MIQNLAFRIRSRSPAAFSAYGYAAQRPDAKTLIYNGVPIPKFLLDHGSNPNECRQWLVTNRIGSPFEETELFSGQLVTVAATAATFPGNPNYVP